LYAEALGDPELKRTRVELEAAMTNASQAQAVVFELFQDLGGFNIDDYKPLSDTSAGMGALESFLKAAVESDCKKFASCGHGAWQVIGVDGATVEA
ncbi:helicase, partial [Glaciimonas sp. Cout2]|nr:helicase [Glaciimonas sp. Cout2]